MQRLSFWGLLLIHWHHYRRLTGPGLSPGLRSWLLDTGSLTARLIAASERFEVSLLDQRWQKPRLDEARALGIPTAMNCNIREVILKGNGQPWVYARSVIPRSSLVGANRQLLHLGNKPLGAFLFSDPTLKRTAVTMARIPPRELPSSLNLQEPVWGRRSRFQVNSLPILVAEIFLPALP